MSESDLHVLGRLSTYLSDQLSPEETKRVEAHLKSCGSCKRHLQDLMRLRKMTRVVPRRPFPVVKIASIVGFLVVVLLARGWLKRYASMSSVSSAPVKESNQAPATEVKSTANPLPTPAATKVEAAAVPAIPTSTTTPKADLLSIRSLLPEWKGVNSGVRDARTVVVESADMWQALWTEHTAGMQPMPELPQVDFSRNAVIGVFGGQKSTAGYAIEIIETRSSPSVMVILYREIGPDSTAIPATTATQPYHLQVIPKSNLLIQFKKV